MEPKRAPRFCFIVRLIGKPLPTIPNALQPSVQVEGDFGRRQGEGQGEGDFTAISEPWRLEAFCVRCAAQPKRRIDRANSPP
jgi:hypothetical protein